MEVEIGARAFRALLKTPARLAGSSSGVHAVTQYVKVTAAEGKTVTAEATDLDVRIQQNATAESVPQSGTCLLPAEILRGILDVLPDSGTVRLSQTGGEVTISAGDAGRWRLQTLPPDDFPAAEVPEVARPLEISGSAGAILGAVSEVLYAAPQSDPRRILQSVAFDIRGDEPCVVGTDGKVLACVPLTGLACTLEGDAGIFCASRSLVEFASHVLTDPDSEAWLFFGERRVTIQHAVGSISGQRPEGKFPDWRIVVPKQATWHLTLKRSALTIEANRAGRVAVGTRKTGGRPIILRFEGGECHVSAVSQDVGSYKSSLPIKGECAPGPIEICFGVEILLETLAHCEGEDVTLCTNGPHAPCIFSGTEDAPGVVRIVMPIKLAEVAK